MSLALLRRYPALTAVVVETLHVPIAGREIAAKHQLEEHIVDQPADLLQDELPVGFDLVLQFAVAIYTTTLFQKLRSVLNPGGRLVILDELFESRAGRSPLHMRINFYSTLGSFQYRRGCWAVFRRCWHRRNSGCCPDSGCRMVPLC